MKTKIIVGTLLSLIAIAIGLGLVYKTYIAEDWRDTTYVDCVDHKSFKACREYLSQTEYTEEEIRMRVMSSEWLQEVTELRWDCIEILAEEQQAQEQAIKAYMLTNMQGGTQ